MKYTDFEGKIVFCSFIFLLVYILETLLDRRLFHDVHVLQQLLHPGVGCHPRWRREPGVINNWFPPPPGLLLQPLRSSGLVRSFLGALLLLHGQPRPLLLSDRRLLYRASILQRPGRRTTGNSCGGHRRLLQRLRRFGGGLLRRESGGRLQPPGFGGTSGWEGERLPSGGVPVGSELAVSGGAGRGRGGRECGGVP